MCANVLAAQCISSGKEQSAIESCNLEVSFELKIAFDYGVSMCLKKKKKSSKHSGSLHGAAELHAQIMSHLDFKRINCFI